MKKHFYHQVISIENIDLELNNLKLADKEKKHLLEIAHSSIHFTVVDVVLSDLNEKDKETFLNHIKQDDHDKTWKFLKSKIENVEEKIKQTAEDLKKDLIKDIKELR